jgi:hypothetical protein
LTCVAALMAASHSVAQQPAPPAVERIGGELAWRIEHDGYGVFEGVDYDDASGELYFACGWMAHLQEGHCRITVARVDRSGKELGRTRLGPYPGGKGEFRLAELDGAAGPEFLISGLWHKEVHAFDRTGRLLWSYAAPSGVDDIWAADLDGNRTDEVIIGLNGRGGVHVVRADGTRLWNSTVVGNVWSVTAAPIGPGGGMLVLTPGRGFDHVQGFDPAGKLLEPFSLKKPQEPKSRGGDVYWVRPANDGERPLVVVCDSAVRMTAALGRDGVVAWRRTFAGGESAQDLAASPDRPWFALAMSKGGIQLHDTRSGDRIGEIDSGRGQSLAWIPAAGGEAPLLVVEGFNHIAAYRIGPAGAKPAPEAVDPVSLGLPAPDPAKGTPVAWFKDRYVYAGELQDTDLASLIVRTLLEDFMLEQKLEPAEKHVRSFKKRISASSGRSAENSAAMDQIAEASVRQWLLNKALYERYGGAVIFQQANPLEPVGAYSSFLKEHEQKRSFVILDPDHERAFWSYYTREHHSTVPPDEVDFSRPWWEQK